MKSWQWLLCLLTNIVGQYRAWQQGGHFYIQMELCEGGSLAQLLFEVRDSAAK